MNSGHALVIPQRHVVSLFELNETEQSDYFDAIHGIRQAIEATDMNDLCRNMLDRDYLRERPKGHIEAVLKGPFLNRRPDRGARDARATSAGACYTESVHHQQVRFRQALG
ncbi:Bis(5'-nucleosyl)-tetraphosphatase (asymmetrical) [Thioalkalivibrio nitratireducens DSM 14787]|uniref:Bis(5'-nucleosyl)-tetraphosphatase (Asymmetrical) n=1 Tax=Thioalkalivibrio nitratireducens (strain DSM 14787 / UNIQEM 213 / ALEN2) TaxID=1255043 RepID=L0E013_THIND|nr:Bis(5'-nucleosyl)-tetraphosphatase (asymmetrical) [Thioalkalivibrio nitratireducens DSM 14787]